MEKGKIARLLKTLGPGIMFAGTCIGGSHLVQSTKAGAFYGFGLLSVVIFANIIKYPFFEFSSRYTNGTGTSILDGYHKLGKWTTMLFAASTVLSMFIVTAAIGAFTGGLAINLVGSIIDLGDFKNLAVWCGIVFVIIFGLLAYGKFGILDTTLKIVGVVLVITVTVAFFSVINGEKTPSNYPKTFDIISDFKGMGFAFTIMLMGWMPMGVDMSSWHSLWTEERIKQTHYHPTLRETLADFNLGYIITVVLAVFFLTIGAYIFYGHEFYTPAHIETLSGLGYAKALVSLFTDAVGSWSRFVIEIAAFATMFGTSITLADGYCRSLVRMTNLLKGEDTDFEKHKNPYLIWVAILFIGSGLIITFYVTKISTIINLATAISFIISPISAYLNYKIIFSDFFPSTHKPGKALKYLAITGILFLSGFTLIYLINLYYDSFGS